MTETQTADVAIVIATFNAAVTLERCLDSIARQTLRPREVVVMDGGSQDDTLEILGRRSDVVTFWKSARDRGIYDAWNKALQHVTTSWVAFLGADDYLWDTESLLLLARKADQVSIETPFIYGKMHEVDEAGNVTEVHGAPWESIRERFRFEMVIPHPGMLHRRSAFFSTSGFDSSYRIAGDYALLRPVLLKHAPAFLDRTIVAAQEGGVSSHPNRRVESIVEAGRAIRACGDQTSLNWHWAMLRNRLRWILWRYTGNTAMERVRSVYRLLAGRQRRRSN